MCALLRIALHARMRTVWLLRFVEKKEEIQFSDLTSLTDTNELCLECKREALHC